MSRKGPPRKVLEEEHSRQRKHELKKLPGGKELRQFREWKEASVAGTRRAAGGWSEVRQERERHQLTGP